VTKQSAGVKAPSMCCTFSTSTCSPEFLVAERYTIADLATFAYSHVTEEAGIDTSAYTAFRSWLDRVGSQPRFVDDLQPYTPNASAKVGRSVYE
jgi:glutathione S-transferase